MSRQPVWVAAMAVAGCLSLVAQRLSWLLARGCSNCCGLSTAAAGQKDASWWHLWLSAEEQLGR